MNNPIKILFSVVILSVLFAVGCKKDNNTDPIVKTTNYIKYVDTTYEVSKGITENYGLMDTSTSNGLEVYQLDLTLLSKGITIYPSNNGLTVDSLVGVGNRLYIPAISYDSTKLGVGIYTYDNSTTSKANTFFQGATFIANGNINVKGGALVNTNIINGTFEVISNTDGYYVINFNLVDDSGKTVTGNYTGPIGFYKGK